MNLLYYGMNPLVDYLLNAYLFSLRNSTGKLLAIVKKLARAICDSCVTGLSVAPRQICITICRGDYN